MYNGHLTVPSSKPLLYQTSPVLYKLWASSTILLDDQEDRTLRTGSFEARTPDRLQVHYRYDFCFHDCQRRDAHQIFGAFASPILVLSASLTITLLKMMSISNQRRRPKVRSSNKCSSAITNPFLDASHCVRQAAHTFEDTLRQDDIDIRCCCSKMCVPEFKRKDSQVD